MKSISRRVREINNLVETIIDPKATVVEAKWLHSGFKCKVMLVRGSHRCGYVALPNPHIAYGISGEDIDVSVHGGLTYAEKGKDGDWRVGFDCAHAGDSTIESPEVGGHSWTLDEVVEETNKLAEQLAVLQECQTLKYQVKEFLKKTPTEKLLGLKAQLETKK